jgi:PPM family protein phosphatase
VTEGDTEETENFNDQVARHYEREPRWQAVVDVAGRTHPGKVRSNNEDQFLAVRRYRGRQILATSLPVEIMEEPEDRAYTYAVADGMGGRQFGQVASLVAIMKGWDLGGDEIKWTVKVNETESEDLRQKAEVLFKLLNHALHDEVRENPRMTGMGTTLTLCYTTGREIFVMHAGDSRAYVHRGNGVIRLTRDHNMAQFLIDRGVAKAGSPETEKMKHVLTNVLGGADQHLVVDVRHERLEDKDTVMVCSDGLYENIPDDEIASVLGSAASAEDACKALEQLALDRGGRDNLTVIVARYRFHPELSPAERVEEG